MKSINDINCNILEGRLLLAALAQITTESQRDKTPDQVLAQVVERADFMFKNEKEIHNESLGTILQDESLEKFWPESSQITRTKYFPNPNFPSLLVEFKSNGKEYYYANVPNEIWKNLLSTESIGSFINKEIKPFYDYKLAGEIDYSPAPKKAAKTVKTSDTGGL